MRPRGARPSPNHRKKTQKSEVRQYSCARSALLGVRQVAYRCRSNLQRLIARNRYRRIYDRFRDYTMVSRCLYETNLQLAASIQHLPGCVIECGVWRGGMVAGLATVLGSSRTYFLFDSFEGLPPAKAIDGAAALDWQANTTSPGYHDNCTAGESIARAAMARAGTTNAVLVKGWFEQTLSTFSPPVPIALLRLDCDWYESTKTCLEHLFPFVSPGGLVLIDDYYTWDGCARAVHDYLSGHERCERIASEGGVCFIKKT